MSGAPRAQVELPASRRTLCWIYGAVALLALVGTWSQNVAYFGAGDGAAGFFLATGRFWVETLANPASTSITVDLLLLCVALFLLMVIEARRLGIRFVWLYVVLGMAIAISVTFPLFLIARERRLAAHGEATKTLGFTTADVIALAALGTLVAAITAYTLLR